MPEKNALICGASGLVGGLVLQRLLDDPAFEKVMAWVRHDLPIEHPKLTQEVIDFDALLDQEAPMPITDVFCTLGTTRKEAGSAEGFRKVDFEYVSYLAKWAAGHDVEKFLTISSMGANSKSKALYTKTKGEMEDAVKTLQLRIPGIYFFRPSMLVGKRNKYRFGEAIGGGFMRLLWPVLPPQYRAIRARAVASAMVETAKTGEEGIHVINSGQMQKMAKDIKK
jgi:uncharacterized protein YbjT (DUF2867 family)